jgi:hypothetical protein
VVDSTGSVGAQASLAFDSYDYPHIAYRDSDNGTLKYAWWDGAMWNFETVDPDSNSISPEIRISSNDNPHIVYTDQSTTEVKYAHYVP